MKLNAGVAAIPTAVLVDGVYVISRVLLNTYVVVGIGRWQLNWLLMGGGCRWLPMLAVIDDIWRWLDVGGGGSLWLAMVAGCFRWLPVVACGCRCCR